MTLLGGEAAHSVRRSLFTLVGRSATRQHATQRRGPVAHSRSAAVRSVPRAAGAGKRVQGRLAAAAAGVDGVPAALTLPPGGDGANRARPFEWMAMAALGRRTADQITFA